MNRTSERMKKKPSQRVGEALSQVAYAEAGELYSEKGLERETKKGQKGIAVCARGETPSGLCV